MVAVRVVALVVSVLILFTSVSLVLLLYSSVVAVRFFRLVVSFRILFTSDFLVLLFDLPMLYI